MKSELTGKTFSFCLYRSRFSLTSVDWQYRGSGASCNDCNSPVNGNGPHRASDGASTTSSQDITPDSSRTTFMVLVDFVLVFRSCMCGYHGCI